MDTSETPLAEGLFTTPWHVYIVHCTHRMQHKQEEELNLTARTFIINLKVLARRS